MLPKTARRVAEHTAEHVNEQILRYTQQNVEKYAGQGLPAIEERLSELEREWDVERTLQTNFAIVTLAGVALGRFVNPRWLLFSGAAAMFMLQHALQGWCPPVPIFRRFWFRTAREIDAERYALEALQGKLTSAAERPDPAPSV